MLLPGPIGYYNTDFIVDIADGTLMSGYSDIKHFVPLDKPFPQNIGKGPQAKVVTMLTGSSYLIHEYDNESWRPLIAFLRTENSKRA